MLYTILYVLPGAFLLFKFFSSVQEMAESAVNGISTGLHAHQNERLEIKAYFKDLQVGGHNLEKGPLSERRRHEFCMGVRGLLPRKILKSGDSEIAI